MKTMRVRIQALLAVVLGLALGIQSCTPFGKVESISRTGVGPIDLNNAWNFTVVGTGTCTLLRIKWGDGTFIEAKDVDFNATGNVVYFLHSYIGWGGAKTITAEGVTNCVGKAQAQINVLPMESIFALAAHGFGSTGCAVIPGASAVRQNSIVHITTSPNAAVNKIDFGCAFSGCVYDADGEPNSSAPSDYPFPGFRKYSLVIRFGPQVVQGGTDFTFTANQISSMEVCVNDNDLSGNSGAWGISIEVDESGA